MTIPAPSIESVAPAQRPVEMMHIRGIVKELRENNNWMFQSYSDGFFSTWEAAGTSLADIQAMLEQNLLAGRFKTNVCAFATQPNGAKVARIFQVLVVDILSVANDEVHLLDYAIPIDKDFYLVHRAAPMMPLISPKEDVIFVTVQDHGESELIKQAYVEFKGRNK